MLDLREALRFVVGKEGSDLHLKVGSRPLARIHGQLEAIEQYRPMEASDTDRVLREMLTDHDKLAEFDREHEVDFAYSVEGRARFRVNAFCQRGSISIAARVIPYAVRTVDELGLPPVMSELADEERGLILVTGTMDTESFDRAMRRVLRQDPDVILIGEMRDEETVRSALSAAETGHLVLSTVPTLDAPETVNRIIDFFPLHEQNQARAMLAGTLKAIVSQRLVPMPDRSGRVAVCEIMRMTGRARDMILDPEQTGRLREVIAEGEYYGMQTFDQALLRHYQAGRVSMEDALGVATSPHDFKLLVAAEGRTSTSMDDIVERSAGPGSAGPVSLERAGRQTASGGPSRPGSSAPPPGVAA